MNVLSNLMSKISQMFRFLLGKRQPTPPTYYSRSNCGSSPGTYTAPVGVKFVKG